MLEPNEAADKHRSLTDKQLILACKIQDEIEDLQLWFANNSPDPKGEDKDRIRFRILKQGRLNDVYRHLDRTCHIYSVLSGMCKIGE